MDKIDIKVGDIVKLRDDLEYGRYYGADIFVRGMKFKNFKKVESIDIDTGEFFIYGIYYWYTKEMIAEVKRLCKYKTIYKREESILNEEERKYLSAVIKPFRNNVQYVTRRHSVIISEYENIIIQYNDDTYTILKNFKAGTMYKGMKLGRIYTLEELGL